MAFNETIEFTRITNALSNLYPKLMNYAATTAVNFFKERFVVGRDINNIPFKKRSENDWGKKRGRDRKGGRGILIDTGTLKRDIQKLTVTSDYAIVGTTRISSPRAKAHNEGFKGEVTQNVKAHERRRFGKEKRGTGVYSVKTRKERTRTHKVVTGTIKVKAFTRRIKQDIPQRQFMGNSPFLDRRIQAEQTRLIIETITKASSQNNK
jgi:phage gpG-like protein